jgi:hypothetical protein
MMSGIEASPKPQSNSGLRKDKLFIGVEMLS